MKRDCDKREEERVRAIMARLAELRLVEAILRKNKFTSDGGSASNRVLKIIGRMRKAEAEVKRLKERLDEDS